MSARLVMRAVRKDYVVGGQAVHALADISLTLAAGEFLAVQGPSGSGKSTLLNICGLIDSATEGHFELDGETVTGLDMRERCRRRRRDIGFIFQRHQLIPAMTVFENIAYPLYLNGIRAREIRQRTLIMLDAIGLLKRQKHLPHQLSGGERQRVGVARALIKQPRLVIADEPSASLDHDTADAILLLMHELNERLRASFLVASHDSFVIEHCHRVLYLADGCLESRA